MCGIVGLWHKQTGQPVDLAGLCLMRDALMHRGPDDAGEYVDGSLGLGHRRLSIIDTSRGGHQPMVSADGKFALVFNGEIYNFRELAAEYLSGVVLRSHSDTEVLLELLMRQGADILPKLRGMFTLGFWDKGQEKLLLARDPFGKKPLYYTETGGDFKFASEIKALLVGDTAPRAADKQALVDYMAFEYVPGPMTGYEGIEQLPAGSYMTVTKDSVDIQSFWQPEFLPKADMDLATATATFDRLLRQACERRLIADVPVGIFLSGGLDSTTIAWYVRDILGKDKELHTFSVSFAETSFNEGAYAEMAAKSVGSVHHDLPFGLTEFKQVLAELVPQMDIPLADASLLPTYAISKLARQFITVGLDGDGSDELLGGYGTFAAAGMAEKPWVRAVGAAVAPLMGALPTSYGNFSFDFKVKSFLRGLPYSLLQRNQVWLGSFLPTELRDLLTPAWQVYAPGVFAPIKAIERMATDLNVTDAISLATMKHYLENDILVKLDRATMLTSLEARTPFLDVDVAEFLMKLPPRFKRDKFLLKHMMLGRIPQAIIEREKKGFGIPLGYWLRGPLYTWAAEILSPEKLTAGGMFEPDHVQRLLQEHKAGKADHRKKLWTLIIFQLWHKQYLVTL